MSNYQKQDDRTTLFLNQREGKFGKFYSRIEGDDSYNVNEGEDGGITLTINKEKHIASKNGKGDGYNVRIGDEIVFINLGESTHGPYAKVDFVKSDSKSPSDEGKSYSKPSSTYNKKKF